MQAQLQAQSQVSMCLLKLWLSKFDIANCGHVADVHQQGLYCNLSNGAGQVGTECEFLEAGRLQQTLARNSTSLAYICQTKRESEKSWTHCVCKGAWVHDRCTNV